MIPWAINIEAIGFYDSYSRPHISHDCSKDDCAGLSDVVDGSFKFTKSVVAAIKAAWAKLPKHSYGELAIKE